MSHAPARTLADMRQHAQEALRRKPVPLDVELLAEDVLELVRRVEELERPELFAVTAERTEGVR